VLRVYRVAASSSAVWVASSNGTVSKLHPRTGEVTEVVQVGLRPEAVTLADDDLWVGGGIGEVVRLNARSGDVEARFRLRGRSIGPVDIAVAFGSVWTLEAGGRRVHKLEPRGDDAVVESMMRLDPRADDMAAGLGGVWTVNTDGTVTQRDPATGNDGPPIHVPGHASLIALTEDAVWVATRAGTVVRIDPTSQRTLGEPVRLGSKPTALAAGRYVWAATRERVVRIDPGRRASD
jgi:DNA-binding beta-propeller fold protein YncE